MYDYDIGNTINGAVTLRMAVPYIGIVNFASSGKNALKGPIYFDALFTDGIENAGYYTLQQASSYVQLFYMSSVSQLVQVGLDDIVADTTISGFIEFDTIE